MAIQMGIGKLGGSQILLKRKFRWTFRIDEACDQVVPEYFVKLAARPNLTIEETEINFLNAKTWIPGKAAWETITVTYYDVATQDLMPLWDWLAAVYDFTDPVELNMNSRRDGYAAKGTLYLYDGCGEKIESWVLNDLWPQAVNFGELDFASSEECTIELTLRYSAVKYESYCPAHVPGCDCKVCSGYTGDESYLVGGPEAEMTSPF